MQKEDKKKKARTGKRGAGGRIRKARSKSAKAVKPRDGAGEIPMGYNEDTIVIMPVNMSTSFIYWEVTEGLLNGRRKSLDEGSSQLMLKVFENDRRREIYSLPVKDRIGKHYLKCRASFNPLVAEIGMLRGKRFTGLLRSSPMNVHSSLENASGDEVWMKKTGKSGAIVNVAERDTMKKRSKLRSLVMHYYHAARSFQHSPLTSGSLVQAPRSED